MKERDEAVDSESESRKTAGRLFDRIYAFYDVKVLAVALSLGVFEALRDQPLREEDLATRVRAGRRGISALVLGLSTLGLVRYDNEQIVLTDAGRRFFLSGSPNFLGGVVGFADWQFDALPRLTEAVRDDAVVWEGFDHYIHGVKSAATEEAKHRQAVFNDGLASGAFGTANAVMAKVDFSDVRKLLDVGGNLGVFSATILARYPEMRATVFDLPQVAEQVRADVRGLGMGERLSAIGGDFVEDPLPSGHDLISFIRIFNSRTDATCLALLRKAYEALPSGGKCLFYEEHVLPEDPNDFPRGALWGAMFMLISSPGELRKISQWERLFAEAGFTAISGIRGKQSGIVVGQKP